MTASVPSSSACLAAASDTESFLVSEGALDTIPAMIVERFAGAAIFLVADENTMEAAGSKVLELITSAGIAVAGRHVFPAEPVLHADYEHAICLGRLFSEASKTASIVPIAIGAGTLNDLVKRGASEAGLPYLCIPTAASVDGYTSYGAALLDGGFKRTFQCPAPRAVVADSAILAGAPPYLTSSGFGDLASKIVAGTDWIIAEIAQEAGAPGCESIDELAWGMTQTGLLEALQASETAHLGDRAATGTLFQALALTGFAMQHLHSSRPVSGCEHLFSHVWEMSGLSFGGRPVTHGHKVAIGTLSATALTETIFANREPPCGDGSPSDEHLTKEGREREILNAFAERPGISAAAANAAVQTALEKLPSRADLARRREAFSDAWKELRVEVLGRLVPYGQLRNQLERAGCPTKPEEIGLSRETVLGTATLAQMIRNRYTALDLAWDLGLLERSMAAMEENPVYLR